MGNGTVCEYLHKNYVDVIKQLAEYYSLPVLDLFRLQWNTAKNKARREYYMPDGLPRTIME